MIKKKKKKNKYNMIKRTMLKKLHKILNAEIIRIRKKI